MTHTPGPWVVDSGDGSYNGIFREENGEPVAYLVEPSSACRVELLPRDERFGKVPLHEYAHAEQHHANAHLIAAAPDLLAALTTAEAFISGAEPRLAIDRNEALTVLPVLRAAIAKAEGRA